MAFVRHNSETTLLVHFLEEVDGVTPPCSNEDTIFLMNEHSNTG